MSKVKPKRRYDARGRTAQAERSRGAILKAARRAFLARGYAATTIREIALAAGVSAETIYKSFGGKPGLVRAVYERGLQGSGPVPAPRRSDAFSEREADPRAIVEHWGKLTAEVAPLVAPILLLMRDAAAEAPELQQLLRQSSAERLERMRHNARRLAQRRFLRRGISARTAADLMWTCTAPELYELLVLGRGWSKAKLGRFVADLLAAALLEPHQRRPAADGRRR